MRCESEDDFGNLFEDLDLTSSKLGKTEEAKNELIVKVLTHLEGINFDLENQQSDLLGDAYDLLGNSHQEQAKKQANSIRHSKSQKYWRNW